MKTLKLFFALLMIVSLFGLQSCIDHYHGGLFIMTGSGPIVSEEVELTEFTGVAANTVIDVEIVQGDEQLVLVEGHENMIEMMDLYVSRGILNVDLKPGSYSNFKLKVFVTVPMLESLAVESTGSILVGAFDNFTNLNVSVRSTGKISSDGILVIDDMLEISTSSTGNVELDVEVSEIAAKVGGTGNVTLTGSCIEQSVELSSTGNYRAYQLYSETCEIVSNSVGDAKVNVTESLDAYINSVGNVYYKGNPKVFVNDRGVGDLVSVRD